MATEAPSLGDFFKSKGKKKIKASNLNKDTTIANPEEKKSNKKSTEDDAWEEEEIKASTIKGVESAGTLKKEEEIKDAEDTAAPAWGPLKTSKEKSNTNVNEKKFPTLQKAVGSSSINFNDDEPKVNIATSKNVFAALETGEDDDEEQSTKRPNQINAIMVSKKKGEREKEAVEREVKKYTGSSKDSKKDAKKKDEEEDEDDDEDEEVEEADAAVADGEARKKKQPEKKNIAKDEKKAKKEAVEERNEEIEEDLKIVFDTVASKAKYEERKKLSPKELPPEELEEEKENRPKAQAKVTSGKKKKFIQEEEPETKLQYIPDDW